jgi:hypothetical protein
MSRLEYLYPRAAMFVLASSAGVTALTFPLVCLLCVIGMYGWAHVISGESQ